MSKTIFFAVLFLAAGILRAQTEVKDVLTIPGPLEIDGTELYLAWSRQPSKTLFRQQYLSSDETIEDFTQLLDFSYFTKEIDIDLAVRQKVEAIQDRMKKDKFAKVNVAESPDGKEFIVDFFVSEEPDKGTPYVEFNAYRFKNIDTGTAKNFLILAYAKRSYGDLKTAFKTLNRQRDHLLATVIEFKIPEIKPVSQ